MKINADYWKLPTIFWLLALLLWPAAAHSQGSAVLVYSHCLYCRGCFTDCAHLPQDLEAPLCSVCQEGAPAISLPRTGQVLCYDASGAEKDCAGTGQDGHYRTGAAWPEPRFIANANGTVTDNLTGLVWLQDANCIAAQHPAFDNDGVVGDGRVTWQHALDFVKGINDNTYPNCGAGNFDWRLPNINELESLMNAGADSQAAWLNAQGFANFHIDEPYWSSTTFAGGSHHAWAMEFLRANGTRSRVGKYSDNLYYVWSVRGTTGPPAAVPKTGQVKCYQGADPWGEIDCAGTGQDGELQAGAFWPAPRFIDNSDGTITDNLTGLMWLKNANCFGRPIWQTALDTIAAFNTDPVGYLCNGYTAAHSDWRLPNVNELESLINYQEGNLAGWLWGDGLLFESVATDYYFSSTSRDNGGYASSAWAAAMGDGEVDPAGKGAGTYVWPVRTAPPRFILTVTRQGNGSGNVVSLNPTGIDCGADCAEAYDQGTVVTLQTTPDPGFVFTGWSGDPDCADGVVTLNVHRTCTAAFDLETHTITVTRAGTGFGVVLIGGPGGYLNCGNDCSASYPVGTGISLDAVAGDHSEFAGWTGDPDCADGSVLLNADKACTATFNLQSHNLIIGKPGSGNGRVISTSHPGIDCGAECSELYTFGTTVTLTATPDPWNVFVGWGGDPDCADSVVTIGDADVVCQAVFDIQNYTLTVDKSGSGRGVTLSSEPGGMYCGAYCPSSSKTYHGGTVVTLDAHTALPYVFTGWSGAAGCAGREARIQVLMDAAKTCTAGFGYLEDQLINQMGQLRAESEKTPDIQFEEGLPVFVSLRVPIPAGLPPDPVLRALNFLDRYKYLYRLDDPKTDFYLKRIRTNSLNQVGGGSPDPAEQHVFFGQQKDGIPVHAASLAVHMIGDKVTSTGGKYLAVLPQLPPPVWKEKEAAVKALTAIDGRSLRLTGLTKPFYFNRGLTAIGGGNPDPSNEPTHLAWRVMVRGFRNSDGAGTSWRVFVNAHDGTILQVQEMNRYAKDFDIESAYGTESDTCWSFTNVDEQWFNENGPLAAYPGGRGNYPGGDADGDNAYAFTHTIYDYFRRVFNRDSHDNDGEEVENYIHVGSNWNNAAYVPLCDHFEFGDGYTVLDAMAHEFTHGVTSNEADLDYDHHAGALNESYSDVFGELVEYWATGTADWLAGTGLPGGYLRNLADPPDKGDPDHYRDYVQTESDHGGVHTNSGIPNKVAYLIVNGGIHYGIPVRGIGAEKTQHLYYKVLTHRLDSNSGFRAARRETLEQAQIFVDNDHQHGFVQADVCSVRNAFASVGLTVADVDCDGILDDEDDDNDGDFVLNGEDNCPNVSNPLQSDLDRDGIGDSCDDDLDGDGIPNNVDNCPRVANAGQEDGDGNGVGDACQDQDGDIVIDLLDNCPLVRNANQADNDGDGMGNVCDDDLDGDGFPDAVDNCSGTANDSQLDSDRDGVGNACDNCPYEANADQRDQDRDGLGDVCDNDLDGDGIPNGADPCPANALPVFIFHGGVVSPCRSEEELAALLSGSYGGLIDGSFSFPTLTEALKIPISPCSTDGCPDWIAENYRTEVNLSLPLAMAAQIVDDRGFVVRKGRMGLEQSLGFRPAADSFFRPPASLTQAVASSPRAILRQDGPGIFKGRSYFLEIFPNAQTTANTPYPFTIQVKSQAVITYRLYLPLLLKGN